MSENFLFVEINCSKAAVRVTNRARRECHPMPAWPDFILITFCFFLFVLRSEFITW